VSRLASAALVAAIRIYQLAVSPWLGAACRFEPSCSRYAIEAVQRHGPIRGSWLAAKRLSRCHPLGDYGYDPLP
jgi:putative membrane protein insertion efficiency factor